jgi:glycosyltransferase involved in cell wall biosynthesis/O-antigen/teichoic acid export membrane protein
MTIVEPPIPARERPARALPPLPATPGAARHGTVLSVAAGLVGLLSYACTLYLAHALPAAEYTRFAGAMMIIGVVGILANALVPLPLADVVSRYARGSTDRMAGMAFAVPVSLAVGLASAAVSATIVAAFAPPGVALATAGAAMVLVAVAPTQGWLQGEQRFLRYAAVAVSEVAVRLAFSVLAVALGWGAAGAVLGFAVGGLVLCCVPAAMLRDLAWRPAVLTEWARWSEIGDVALTRLVVASLVAADVVLVALLGAGSTAEAGYSALATLAKAPVYVAAGTVLVVFPLLRAGAGDAADALRAALRAFGALAVVAAAVLATLPPAIALLVLPVRYADSLRLLPWLGVAGLGYAAVTVLTTVLLGARRHRRCRYALGTATVAMSGGLGAGWALAGTPGLAVGSALGATAAAAAVGALAVPALPAGTGAAAARGLAAGAGLAAVLGAARLVPALWLVLAGLAGLLALRGGLRAPVRGPHPGPPGDGSSGLRILHLGFEDPAMPGAGGGSVRTHEINRRLAQRHDITVLVARFPGCADRVQDGVRYRHVGVGAGGNRLTRTLGYAVAAVPAARRCPADLVVEDFFAPISTMAAPRWTRRPTIGVVQWLNARDKARQYKLPFHVVERFGVRNHHRVIAVSDGVAERLRTLNPRLLVHVIGNGVAPEAFGPPPRRGTDVVFVGRLEIAQKGLDLLLQAWAEIAERVGEGRLVIAGTGPDERRLATLAAGLGVADRVRFIGWVGGADKFDLIASARVVVVPSRFETFGIVAVEALATGTPVVAFDIPCLREVVPVGCGALVPPYDVAAFGAAVAAYCRDGGRAADGAHRARAFAAGFGWDSLAREQEQVYRSAAYVGTP